MLWNSRRFRLRWLLLVAVPFVITAAQGCSSSTRSDDDETEEVDPEALAVCELLERGAALHFGVVTGEQCHVDDVIGDIDELSAPFSCESGDWFFDSLEKAIISGTLSVDIEQLEECRDAAHGVIGELTTMGEGNAALLVFEEMYESISECEDLFVGNAAEGDDCALTVECIEGLRCELDLDSLLMVCLQPALEGEECRLDGVRRCAEGLRCFEDRCTAYRDIGQDCFSDGDCRPEAFCSDDSSCAPRREEGESCRSSSCVDGLYCTDDEICRFRVESGEVCEGSDACSGFCQVCRPDDVDLTRRCLARGEGGASCFEHDHCRAGLFCDETGHCRNSLELGESCDEDEQCDRESAFCESSSGECHARLGVGDDCSGNLFACQEDLYCHDGRCLRGESGDGCDHDSYCISGYCEMQDSWTGVCRETVSVGEECDQPSECGEGAGCVDGLCRGQGEAGAMCESGGECISGLCRQPRGRCEPFGNPYQPGCNIDVDVNDALLTQWTMLAGFLVIPFFRRRRR